jgi:uroporphyrinogen-III decarboxylase
MSVEITVPIRVTLLIDASVLIDGGEAATFDEIRVWLGRNPDAVARAVESAIDAKQTYVGPLDADASLFIDELVGVDASAIRRSGAALEVFATES